MIASINSYTPYRLLYLYFEPMALTDKIALLQAILDKYDDYGWSYTEQHEENDEQCFPLLVPVMEKTYGRQTLLAALKKAETGRFYFRSNRFLTYLKTQLAAPGS